MNTDSTLGTLSFIAAVLGWVALTAPARTTPAVPVYEPVSGVSGTLGSAGSDTMNNLMTLWSEAFLKMYPGVRIEVEGRGSATAPPALIAGTAQLAPMSRSMTEKELGAFVKRYGYEPTQIRTSLDALAVYVNKSNPLERLTLTELDAVFSRSRKRGGRAVDTWGQLGLSGEWAAQPIRLYGRNSASGTYLYFKEHVLRDGEYRDAVQRQPGSASVVESVAEDRYGIGYSGIGYKTSSVKTLALSEDGTVFSGGEPSDVFSGRYPLARHLYIYVNRRPGRALDPPVREFLRFVLSRQGQEIVAQDGYLREPDAIVAEELAKLDLAQSSAF